MTSALNIYKPIDCAQMFNVDSVDQPVVIMEQNILMVKSTEPACQSKCFRKVSGHTLLHTGK